MLTSSWIAPLRQKLNSLPTSPGQPSQTDNRPRLAIVGVGNALRGDDVAGIAVVQGLASRLNGRQPVNERLCLVEAGQSPEAFTGVIRRFKPSHVLIIDCADMGEAPGTIDWLSWNDVDGLGASTHTFPLSLFATYLINEIGCEILLLGIQPTATLFGSDASPAMRDTIQQVTDSLDEALQAIMA